MRAVAPRSLCQPGKCKITLRKGRTSLLASCVEKMGKTLHTGECNTDFLQGFVTLARIFTFPQDLEKYLLIVYYEIASSDKKFFHIPCTILSTGHTERMSIALPIQALVASLPRCFTSRARRDMRRYEAVWARHSCLGHL